MPSWGINSIGFFFFLRFIYFYFLAVVFVAAHGLSLVVGSEGCSLGACMGFSSSGLLIAVASVFLAEPRLALHGFSSCGSWALEHRLSSGGTQFSCTTACGIFQTISLQGRFLTTGPPGKPIEGF